MFSQDMMALGKKRSTIREIFEYGNRRSAEVGRENIFDFSLGNPNVPAPQCVTEELLSLIHSVPAEELHGYTSAPGANEVRQAIADNLNRTYRTAFRGENIYMTVGAAAAICAVLKALAEEGDEFVVPAPFFPEYRCWITYTAKASCVVVPAQPENFQINFAAMEQCIRPQTKAVIINSPNNPSGVVYSEETIRRLAALLEEKQREFGHPIFLISDEPYREIVYDGKQIPFVTKYYRNTIVCYSFSKSLSLPGERIGYVLIPDELEGAADAFAAVCGAGRILGYVNAPGLFQRVAAACAGQTAELAVYDTNRKLLYEALQNAGYSCVKPEGAFYIFPQALEADEYAFCERAKKYDLLLVPGSDFGCPGHVRISYCVKTETVQRALPLFERLAREYQER